MEPVCKHCGAVIAYAKGAWEHTRTGMLHCTDGFNMLPTTAEPKP